MSEPFIGEIRMFAGNFAPRNWAFCDGQLLPISNNSALYSLLSTFYGGDGRTTFGLPDLRGRLPVHFGNGPGVSQRRIGQKTGVESVTLNLTQFPSHNHNWMLNQSIDAESREATGRVLGKCLPPASRSFDNTNTNSGLTPDMIKNNGSTEPHSNLMPSLCINFIIALNGIYPSRS